MSNLYIICGIPGSGKSTFAKNTFLNYNTARPYKIISRDAIRFSLLKEGEGYFSHESEVYKIFWETITNALNEGFDVIADQTSLTPNARAYLLNNVSGYDETIAIEIKTTLKECLARNDKRVGKEHVPPSVIEKMHNNYISPTIAEGFSQILTYDTEKNIFIK